ncbi:MAG TPA: DUF445 domain-containing protein [Methylomusa anaerophila]|uniref:DUF445 domain-containing protein n=1 Tax=Methylomusa anaerophila TaxID=1930071 RepID=UPI001315AD6B|nr:DUF445 domain-containing protein [Methylomusa anaerophila]HML90656.1 DUF445 domain-containing protein [Methylomusa anaerophila]
MGNNILGGDGVFMNECSNKRAAMVTLAAVTLGLLVSYPFKETFIGGVVVSGCSAAMIGGIADWFAVTALFRRPLGIPFRTALIPNNRERIFEAIVTMVEKELLSMDNIKLTLKQISLTELALHYGNAVEARERLQLILGHVIEDFLFAIRVDEVHKTLLHFLKDNADEIKVAPLVGQAVEWSVREGFADSFLDLLVREFEQMARQEETVQLIAKIYRRAMAAYSSRQNQRKVASWILENLLHVAPETVAAVIQGKLLAYLDQLHDPEQCERRKMKVWLLKLAKDLKTDSEFQRQAEKLKKKILFQPELENYLTALFCEMRTVLLENSANMRSWTNKIMEQFGQFWSGVACDSSQREEIDNMLNSGLSKWIDAHHTEIGSMVAGYLRRWSSDELVCYIETRVGNDLQMIRISGSVVGGVAGMLLFLLTSWLGVAR